MGQKVHPNVIRLKIINPHNANWYDDKNYAKTLYADIMARRTLKKMYKNAGISRILIERPANNQAILTVYAARPGMIIGKRGKESVELNAKITKIMGIPAHVNIREVRKPEIDAENVALNVAQQIEKRVQFRRAMKRAMSTAMRAGAQGIKIRVAGRLGGAEIARAEWYLDGRVPLHTFRADIDYGTAEAYTTYGIIGIKVWIFKGEVFDVKKDAETAGGAK